MESARYQNLGTSQEFDDRRRGAFLYPSPEAGAHKRTTLINGDFNRVLVSAQRPLASRRADIGSQGSDREMPFATFVLDHLRRGDVARARSLLQFALSKDPENPELNRMARVLAPPVVRSASLAPGPKLRIPGPEALREYAGQWVALVDGQVVEAAGSLKLLLAQLSRLPTSVRPIVHLVND
jgi:hypothetical protein